MIEIREVKTKAQQKAFIEFPVRLYKDNPCFVPPLYMDEVQLFKSSYHYYSTCEAVYYLAYLGNQVVGRISGILQKAANEKYNQKRVRFTRFDSIDSQEVANALFEAVENWARSKGMDEVCGPLGFSDLEREGLLIEGFDQMCTFEEQYNAPYYQSLIENLGYTKEVDWTESKLYLPKEDDGTLKRLSDFVMKRYKLHFGTAPNIREWIRLYADDFFNLLDKSYENIYGTVPFTDEMKKSLISTFKLVIDLRYVSVILDENDRPVCIGLAFPSIAKEVAKCRGHLNPVGLVRVLHAIHNPKVIDLCLVGVDPKYANCGISAVFADRLMDMLRNDNLDHAETNLNLEDNVAIRNLWKRFTEVQNKRRRAYVKRIV